MALFGLTRPLNPGAARSRRRTLSASGDRGGLSAVVAAQAGEPGLPRTLGADLAR